MKKQTDESVCAAKESLDLHSRAMSLEIDGEDDGKPNRGTQAYHLLHSLMDLADSGGFSFDEILTQVKENRQDRLYLIHETPEPCTTPVPTTEYEVKAESLEAAKRKVLATFGRLPPDVRQRMTTEPYDYRYVRPDMTLYDGVGHVNARDRRETGR